MNNLGARALRVCASAALLFAALLSSCSHKPIVAADNKPAGPPDTVPVPHTREADDVARFIAGLPGKPGGPFADLEESAEWKEHRRLIDRAWKRAESELIGGLQEFQNRELGEAVSNTDTLFYPFGGPDALTPTVFFPHSRMYVLIGLEPAGTL